MSRRIVIVGAGPGGLASAMLLARTGADVTVVERLDRVGGRSSTIEAEGGYRFDMGPTFFLYPRVLSDIFAACGKDLSREVDLIRLDPQYHLVFEAGGELRASPNQATMAEQVAKLSPADAANLPRFMSDNRRKLAAFRPVLEKAFNSAFDLVDPALLKSLPLMRPHQSVDEDLSRYFADPRVRLAFSFQSKYLGMSPFRCPSLFTILSFMEYEFGVHHPRGGTGAVMAAMAKAATEMGVRIRLNEPVEEILFQGRKAVGVRTNAGEYKADALVINSDFAQTMTRLVPNHLRKRWTDEKIDPQEILLLHLHALSRDRGHVARSGAPHDLPDQGLRAEHQGYRGRAGTARRAQLLCPERLRHRSGPGTSRPQHPLRSGAGGAPRPA